MPLPGVVQIPEAKKQAVLADVVAGMSQKAVAAKHGVHPVTVNKWWNRWKRHQPPDIVAVPSVERLKQDLVQPAFAAISRGLNCTKNVVASGTLAVQVLKGIGVFAPDGPNLSLHFSQPPQHWASAAALPASPALALPAAASSSSEQAAQQS